MSSLKQKIREKVIIIDEQAGNRYSYKNTEVVRLNDVLALLSEATKQIREMTVGQDLEYTHPSTEFWKGWNKAIDRVLAVLEGEKK